MRAMYPQYNSTRDEPTNLSPLLHHVMYIRWHLPQQKHPLVSQHWVLEVTFVARWIVFKYPLHHSIVQTLSRTFKNLLNIHPEVFFLFLAQYTQYTVVANSLYTQGADCLQLWLYVCSIMQFKVSCLESQFFNAPHACNFLAFSWRFVVSVYRSYNLNFCAKKMYPVISTFKNEKTPLLLPLGTVASDKSEISMR